MSDSNTQQDAKSATTATFVTALVFNAIVFGAEIVLFTILRPYFKSIYEPRAHTIIAKKRVQPLAAGLLTWPWAVFKADYRTVQHVNGMDAYFFVRFLRMMVRILVPIWLISWVVLFPVTSVDTFVSGKSGLDKYSFGNVSQDTQSRYWAHLILTWGFTIWIWYNIKTEMQHFIVTHQKHLIHTAHSRSVQANTVLVTGIPIRYLTEHALRKMFGHLPGGVKTVWINRDLKELPDLYDRRNAACSKLESAETSLLSTAAQLRLKKFKADAKAAKKNGGAVPEPSSPAEADPERDMTLAERLVPKNKRPTHRLPAGFMPFSLPLIGQVVDTIDWAKEEIATTTKLLDEGRAKIEAQRNREAAPHKGLFGKVPVVGGLVKTLSRPGSPFDPKKPDGSESPRSSDAHKEEKEEHAEQNADSSSSSTMDYPPLSSAFLTFHQQAAAHMAGQVLAHHDPYRMASRYVDIAPEDVIWGNLGMNAYESKIRIVISYAMTAGLIILWAIPVAFVGIVSNVHSLCMTYKWLAWLCHLPDVVVGIISGILPPVLLAVLTMLLPIILRLLARFEGIPRRTGLELSLMTRFFIFQVIHSFLIVTISSGIINALPDLVKNPTGIPSLLATRLPQASIFFLTYIVLQGLSGAAGGFLQIVSLIIYYVKLYILGSTPRSIYGLRYPERTVAWGTLFPSITLLVVITLGYSIISPVINGLAALTFFLFYLLYKYLFLWVLEQPASSDTGGLFFPKAIQHIFVGLYVQQICLCALFFLAQNGQGKPGAIPEGALMVVLIIFTAFFHVLINNSYGPLIHHLPLSLADRTYSATQESAEQDREPLLEQGAKGKGVGSPETSPTNKPQNIPEKQPLDTLPEDKGITRRDPYSQQDYGFAQPAASRPQPTIWVPRDTLGLGAEEVESIRSAGIDVSTEGAVMDGKGHVDIDGPPPNLEASN